MMNEEGTGGMVEVSQEEFAQLVPPGAAAAIVARYDVDRSDPSTDFFQVRTVFEVVIGFSPHTNDTFSEMRKAAARFGQTQHLGPGKTVCRVRAVLTSDVREGSTVWWAEQFSPWHMNCEPGGDGRRCHFTTRQEAEDFIASSPPPIPYDVGGQVATAELRIFEESIEHREKYAGGRGYYLKAEGTYASGWSACKYPLPLRGPSVVVASYLARPGIGRLVAGPWEAVPDAPTGKLAQVVEEAIAE